MPLRRPSSGLYVPAHRRTNKDRAGDTVMQGNSDVSSSTRVPNGEPMPRDRAGDTIMNGNDRRVDTGPPSNAPTGPRTVTHSSAINPPYQSLRAIRGSSNRGGHRGRSRQTQVNPLAIQQPQHGQPSRVEKSNNEHKEAEHPWLEKLVTMKFLDGDAADDSPQDEATKAGHRSYMQKKRTESVAKRAAKKAYAASTSRTTEAVATSVAAAAAVVTPNAAPSMTPVAPVTVAVPMELVPEDSQGGSVRDAATRRLFGNGKTTKGCPFGQPSLPLIWPSSVAPRREEDMDKGSDGLSDMDVQMGEDDAKPVEYTAFPWGTSTGGLLNNATASSNPFSTSQGTTLGKQAAPTVDATAMSSPFGTSGISVVVPIQTGNLQHQHSRDIDMQTVDHQRTQFPPPPPPPPPPPAHSPVLCNNPEHVDKRTIVQKDRIISKLMDQNADLRRVESVAKVEHNKVMSEMYMLREFLNVETEQNKDFRSEIESLKTALASAEVEKEQVKLVNRGLKAEISKMKAESNKLQAAYNEKCCDLDQHWTDQVRTIEGLHDEWDAQLRKVLLDNGALHAHIKQLQSRPSTAIIDSQVVASSVIADPPMHPTRGSDFETSTGKLGQQLVITSAATTADTDATDAANDSQPIACEAVTSAQTSADAPMQPSGSVPAPQPQPLSPFRSISERSTYGLDRDGKPVLPHELLQARKIARAYVSANNRSFRNFRVLPENVSAILLAETEKADLPESYVFDVLAERFHGALVHPTRAHLGVKKNASRASSASITTATPSSIFSTRSSVSTVASISARTPNAVPQLSRKRKYSIIENQSNSQIQTTTTSLLCNFSSYFDLPSSLSTPLPAMTAINSHKDSSYQEKQANQPPPTQPQEQGKSKRIKISTPVAQLDNFSKASASSTVDIPMPSGFIDFPQAHPSTRSAANIKERRQQDMDGDTDYVKPQHRERQGRYLNKPAMKKGKGQEYAQSNQIQKRNPILQRLWRKAISCIR